MTPMSEWESDGVHNDWIMPAAPKWKRLPIIRHIRAIDHYRDLREIERVAGFILPMDRWIAHGVWLGKERDHG